MPVHTIPPSPISSMPVQTESYGVKDTLLPYNLSEPSAPEEAEPSSRIEETKIIRETDSNRVDSKPMKQEKF